MQRNFNCPETEAPCIDGRCTKMLCCERERMRVAETKASIDQKERAEEREFLEIIDEAARLYSERKNSN